MSQLDNYLGRAEIARAGMARLAAQQAEAALEQERQQVYRDAAEAIAKMRSTLDSDAVIRARQAAVAERGRVVRAKLDARAEQLAALLEQR